MIEQRRSFAKDGVIKSDSSTTDAFIKRELLSSLYVHQDSIIPFCIRAMKLINLLYVEIKQLGKSGTPECGESWPHFHQVFVNWIFELLFQLGGTGRRFGGFFYE